MKTLVVLLTLTLTGCVAGHSVLLEDYVPEAYEACMQNPGKYREYYPILMPATIADGEACFQYARALTAFRQPIPNMVTIIQ